MAVESSGADEKPTKAGGESWAGPGQAIRITHTDNTCESSLLATLYGSGVLQDADAALSAEYYVMV